MTGRGLMSELLRMVKRLLPIERNIVSEGNFITNRILASMVATEPNFLRYESGETHNGWTVPKSWNIDGYSITDLSTGSVFHRGARDLGVVIGSSPVLEKISGSQLRKRVHTSTASPSSTPYITSYYGDDWGFCMPEEKKGLIRDVPYEVQINVDQYDSHMELMEYVFPGRSRREVLISTYNCHPYMANNELSGPVVWAALAQKLSERKGNHYYTYRFYMGPETIGAIFYLKSLGERQVKTPQYAITVNCCGSSESKVSLLQGKSESSPLATAARRVLGRKEPGFLEVSHLDRGSDERQWAAPKNAMDTLSLLHPRYHEYSEYHTSQDNLDLISEKGLQRAVNLHLQVIEEFELIALPLNDSPGEPKLDRAGLYPTMNLGGTSTPTAVRDILNFLHYSDGFNDLESITELIGCSLERSKQILRALTKHELVSVQASEESSEGEV